MIFHQGEKMNPHHRFTHFKPKTKEEEIKERPAAHVLAGFEVDEEKLKRFAKTMRQAEKTHHLTSTQCFDEKKRDKYVSENDSSNINPPWKY